ncbi:10152_t:CDS:2, partial [Funneliformis geosporum]
MARKLSGLIHSSQGCENLVVCNVVVHFEEILDTVVPQSQLVISRQAFRNNASKYFINGRQSNYTEVTNEAPNKHEDGLLEFLDDIIGTSKYKIPLEEANEKLELLDKEHL